MYIYTVCVVYLFSTIIFQPVVIYFIIFWNRYKYCYQYECVNLSKVGQVQKMFIYFIIFWLPKVNEEKYVVQQLILDQCC